jgi:hypothetical protein
MREFFATKMHAEAAHRERWREGLDEAQQEEIGARYEDALGQLEREGYHCAAVLRRAHGRSPVTT